MASGPRVVLFWKSRMWGLPLPAAGSGYTGLKPSGSRERRMAGVGLLNGFVDLVRMQALGPRTVHCGYCEIIRLASCEVAGGVARV